MVFEAGSPLFSFGGKHCADFDIAFIPRRYPFIAAQTVPTATIAGRHGTLRFKGRTFAPRTYAGTVYLLDPNGDIDPIATQDMLERASDIAAWLCGTDARQKLVLDALPDRFWWAEVTGESALADADWLNGSAQIIFVCQPFAHSMRESTASATLAANAAHTINLSVPGNAQTPLAFSVTNASGEEMNALIIEAPGTRFVFADLALQEGETLTAGYTPDDLLLLTITDADGAQRSAMSARTMDSDDDLLLSPGGNQITVTADQACSVRLTARGRWM